MIELNKKVRAKFDEVKLRDEEIIYVVNAISQKYKNTISFGKTLYAILTNKRIVLLDKGTFNVQETATINLDKIDTINKKDKLLGCDIYIYTNSVKTILENVERKEASKFIKRVNQELENYKVFSIQINKTVEKDITDKIEKLSELYKDGVLTEYEFFMKKKELLEKLK